MKAKHIVMLITATLMTFAFVWVRLQIVSISYEINALSQNEKNLREECNTLSLKISEAKSPQRLEHLAKTKFNMQPARVDQIVTLRSEE